MASTTATPIPFAAFAAGSLHSSMASLEQAATRRLIRAELLHTATSLLLAAVLLGTATAITGSPGGAAEAIRNLMLYAGLALVSGRVFGRASSWVLPVAGFIIVAFWGADGAGHPHSWAWQFQVYDNAMSWIAATSWLVAGVGALALPPRPLALLTSRIHPHHRIDAKAGPVGPGGVRQARRS